MYTLCVSYRGERARFDATADWSGFLPLHWVLGTAMEFRKTGQMAWKTGHSSLKISNWWLKNFFSSKTLLSHKFLRYSLAFVSLWPFWFTQWFVCWSQKERCWRRNSGWFKNKSLLTLRFAIRISFFKRCFQGKGRSCWNLSSFPCFCLRNSGFHLRQICLVEVQAWICASLTPFYVFGFEF